MSRLLLVLLCLALPWRALAVDAAEGRSIPYQKLYAPLAAVRQADPQGVVASSVHAESTAEGQPLPPDLKIEFRAGATRQAIRVDPNGRFELPMHADQAGTVASLWINQPKSAVKIVESFTMRTPAATHLSYGQLMESLPVMERIQQQHVEIGGLMATKPDGVELAYEPGIPQTVAIGAGPKAKIWNTDDQGHVHVPFDPAVPATTPVTLSALPVALQPYAP